MKNFKIQYAFIFSLPFFAPTVQLNQMLQDINCQQKAFNDMILCIWENGTHPKVQSIFVLRNGWTETVQVFEVSPDKKIVWALSSWDKLDVGPATYIQILGEPGNPETGELHNRADTIFYSRKNFGAFCPKHGWRNILVSYISVMYKLQQLKQ